VGYGGGNEIDRFVANGADIAWFFIPSASPTAVPSISAGIPAHVSCSLPFEYVSFSVPKTGTSDKYERGFQAGCFRLRLLVSAQRPPYPRFTSSNRM
jgi:hypothetical protein